METKKIYPSWFIAAIYLLTHSAIRVIIALVISTGIFFLQLSDKISLSKTSVSGFLIFIFILWISVFLSVKLINKWFTIDSIKHILNFLFLYLVMFIFGYTIFYFLNTATVISQDLKYIGEILVGYMIFYIISRIYFNKMSKEQIDRK